MVTAIVISCAGTKTFNGTLLFVNKTMCVNFPVGDFSNRNNDNHIQVK